MKSKNQDTLDFMRNIIGEEKFMEVVSALAGERITFPRSFQWLGQGLKRLFGLLLGSWALAEFGDPYP